jgi:hypothetical protein
VCRFAAAYGRKCRFGADKLRAVGTRIVEVQRPHFLIAVSLTVFACSSGPPAKTASGEVIEGITYEERFPRTPDVHEVSFKGERLRKAVALMDSTGVTGLEGSFNAAGVLDQSTLILTIHGAEQRKRTIVVKNCAEQHVCAFFAMAVKGEIVEKAPVVCRDSVRCIDQ